MLGIVLYPNRTEAQVTSDNTLAAEESIVRIVPNDGVTYQITGGATRGDNLFHSFAAFSLPAGDIAAFENSDRIANIITRVTGDSLSEIDGTIQTSGNANLFLMNPAGIVFGPNARLDVGGSFVASTGEGVGFENGFIYGVDTAEVPPLLTISAPIGLSLGNAPGPITGVGQGDTAALSVAEGQTLALIGGDISLSGVRLAAPGGRIELGAVRSANALSLISDSQGFGRGF